LVEENALSAQEPIDPVTVLTRLGYPRPLAAWLVAVLRGDVTDTVCRLLPGAASLASAGWLLAAVMVQLQVAPRFIMDREPGLAPGQARTAGTLPAQLMYVIFFELDSRDRGTSEITPELHPSDELRAFRPEAERQVSELFGGYAYPARESEAVRLVRDGLGEILNIVHEKGQPAWGGWLLLATVLAIRTNPDLPRPGRKRRRLPWNRNRATAAGIAYQLAETLALAMALGLLDRTP
jgi:hypothetical protein